ncbi:YciI family protein [Hydrogenophaga palleronii]|uniref:YciI family protein n=1 Tax=Hydrogenophaga palleronii TaxID=65655 RepID=UPI000825D7DA|nr:YciI family protein [Hydrogenophaga palleronii]
MSLEERDDPPVSEYLVISRGQWDADKSPEEIQASIDAFYRWYSNLVEHGVMRTGQRLEPEGKRVSRERILDGPFTEAKEVIGGFWFVRARSLTEAASLMADNPCLACGLEYDVRPLAQNRCNAFERTCETPERPANDRV